MTTNNVRNRAAIGRHLSLILGCAIGLMLCESPARAEDHAHQQTFTSPSTAVEALVAATRGDRVEEMVRILGPDGKKLVYSGDRVADDAGRDHFVAAYEQFHEIQMQGGDKAVLVIGDKHWPFPIPVVKSGDAWHFDTPAGEQEILDRRIGRNELNAIKVCKAIVDAQRDYAERVRTRDGIVEYARKFISDPGTHDGLYWPVQPGQPESPIGPLLADAHAEGYGNGTHKEGRRHPYHGYYYRLLMRQGKDARDGAYDYLVNGHMIGGFAMVAFPAKYGNSGIMTFIVNQDGIVFQRNLGQETADVARAMHSFDPGPGWQKVSN